MTLIKDIIDFVLPQRCFMCGNRLSVQERSICTVCYAHLPFTGYHLAEHSPLEKYFCFYFPIERAVSYFHHDGERTRSIIYHIKYYGHPEAGEHLAYGYAEELKEHCFFKGIDAIVPIPLHWRRKLERHYNQSYHIAKGISRSTGIPIWENVVKRMVNNVSQTRVARDERLDNVKNIFRVTDAEKVKGKHLLLVDDVITTGATIKSCAKELAKVSGVKISVLSLAVASQSAVQIETEVEPDASVFGIPLLE